ncbi:hypothetical protein BO70DRAFT_360330 [Aspergillus heteromorphus CBS 117.55]|uniref:Uncharacterized protein n=1 Tax=Aspergillus heteromorphus CBS 117.55 TaxID=1448321 RepID=A0A317WS09_9EURO|nr:uncharacterized protein BO70DRAFT_360330 [Aspergillus heteromorphus CBS 117.55]PWY87688.1 hypothetical protein BO70DRAFT_360330 [Aspergillus heteromorphus CBS 117.55]
MPALEVPDTGLSLCRDNHGNDATGRPPQIMRLNLAQSTLDELIQSLRTDETARIRLGKHQTLYYGSKSQSFHSVSEPHRSELYSGSAADKENLYFTGLLSHSLEVQKAKEATAATDQALANLEQSLNAFERGKESKKTHIITSFDEVRALRAGDSRSSTGKHRLSRVPASKVELEKDRLLNAANRSVSSSPALGVARSPVSMPPLTPTSAPVSQNKDRIRLEALKVPFIHLLAVRAVSANFLARLTRSSIEDCETLARKYGTENRINPEKYDLRDKTYRDLDVWKFPYPSQEDRQEAIENAISAFDRMRVSRSDKLWQTLLPKEERGKGKCLSRLDLRTGPIKKAATPRIQVHASEENGKEGYTTGQETDKVNGNGPTPKAAEPTSAPKPGATAQKKRPGDKDTGAKRPPAKSKAAPNSTLTGRVTKKAERKTTVKPEGKFKSAEYVHDSDDDTDMPDASSTERPRPEKTKPEPKPLLKVPDSSTPRESSHVPTPKFEPPEPAPRSEPTPLASSKPTAMKRPPSSRPPAQKSPQKSPQKPSPLGSSPPTNVSDIQSRSRSSSQNNSSSSSSSPLITQVNKPIRPPTGAPTVKKVAKPNGVSRPNDVANPLKRKAELERPAVPPRGAGRTTGDLEHKRRRAVSTSSGSTGSTGSASPPLSREILLQQLREKAQKFKQYYTKYRTLHDALASQADPPRVDLDRLQKQHLRLQRMKKEIWDEDRRLRD